MGYSILQQKYMHTEQHNSPLVYMFSAGDSHLLIHIHETVGNLGLYFDTILSLNLILASFVPAVHSH